MNTSDDSGPDPYALGRQPSGPDFVPWSTPAAAPPPVGPPRPPFVPPPSRSRRPGVITAAVVAVVGLVTAGGTIAAHYADTHVAAPQRATLAPRTPVSQQFDRITFETDEGGGELILREWSWSDDGNLPPSSGSYLRLEIELVCTSGTVSYSPFNFAVFDASGSQYEFDSGGTLGPILEAGFLLPGENARGGLAFDLPRGETTLLMTDGGRQTVTALRVPD